MRCGCRIECSYGKHQINRVLQSAFMSSLYYCKELLFYGKISFEASLAEFYVDISTLQC